MSILVTGATGTVGSQLLQRLAQANVPVRALTRDPAKAHFPAGVAPVAGNLLDVASMRTALADVRTLFLLTAVAPDELTQALLTLNLAREAGIERIVYFSVFRSDTFTNVPHFASKYTVERMIEEFGIPATILRANCFMQNDAGMFRDALLGPGFYPFPIGDRGVSMVDVGDIADVAAQALLQRDRAESALPHEVVNLVGPEALTGTGIAAIWTSLLEKTVTFTGNDARAFEAHSAHHIPGWMAMDFRLMLERFQSDGMQGSDHDVEEMTRRLGRAPRAYADFAKATLTHWRS